MLDKVEEELFEKFNKVFVNNTPVFETANPLPLLLDLFHQIEKERELLKVFLGPHGDIAFQNRMTDLVSLYITAVWETHAQKTENLNYFNAFIVSGCVGVIKEWLNTENNKSPEEMAQLCSQIISQAFDIFAD